MSKTTIEWCDFTINPLRARFAATKGDGHYCEKISDGCKHCYASKMQPRFRMPRFDAQRRLDVEHYLDEGKLRQVIERKTPTRWFWCDMTDMFGAWVPDEHLDRLFATMALTPQHTHQVLTKRADRMREYFAYEYRWAQIEGVCDDMVGRRNAPALATPERLCLPNVWLGVSVEDQSAADTRISLLLQTPAAVRFLSCEPLIGPIDLGPWLEGNPECSQLDPDCLGNDGQCHDACEPCGLHWMIVGGESGHGARPFHIKWARSIIGQCGAAGVPVFVKQLGAVPVNAILGPVNPVNLRAVGLIKHRKGAEMSEWPDDLRVREFPEARQ